MSGQLVTDKITHPNSVIYFQNGDDNKPWEVRYNFENDGDNLGSPSTQDTSVLSFFDNAKITSDQLTDLKIYIFEPKVNLISQNHLVGQNNSADSKADIGLSLSNKRKNITFNDKVNFISSFTFYDEGNTAKPDSGVSNAKIATGIYNAFGASEITEDSGDLTPIRSLLFKDNSVDTTAYAQTLGVITFNEYATVSVTHTNRSTYADKGTINEVFGVFNNEGGTTLFENGATIIAKGKTNDRIVSAVVSTSTKGILDPLKQGIININGNKDGTTSHIWAISDNQEEQDNFIKPFANKNAEDFNLDKDWNEFFENIKNSDHLKLGCAVISLHGSSVNINDTDTGAIDIRGDILSSTLNGDGATSNTVGHKNKVTSGSSKWSDLSGVVIRSNVDINLQNEKSVLYGNVYERHRITEDELVDDTYLNPTESFKEWQTDQIEKEKTSLGGNVNLTLSNKATWYPQQNWKGWNNDFVYSDFENALNEVDLTQGSINYNEISYKKIDFSDQYNLHVYENGIWSIKNENSSNKINDLNSNFSSEKTGEYTTVDNGIYHLTLNDGGVVDTRYMRQAFSFSNVDTINNGDFSSSSIDKGIKKLRIQELAGTGGTFNIYVKDYDNHDLIIIDQLASEQAKANSTINFKIWNTTDKDFDETLGIVENKPNTYIQIGRVAKDLKYDPNIKLGPKDGDIQSVTYTIETDNDYSWTKGQYLEYHKQMQNLFITKADIQKVAPDIIEGARLSSSLAYNYAIMDIDRLQKRRGEARHIKDSEDGIWARYRHINSGLTGNDDSADMIQIGYDYKVRNDESYNIYSIAVDYLRGQSDFDESGDSDLNRYSIGLYDTWLLDNGAYLDLTAKVGWFDADMDARFRHVNGYYEVNGDYDFWGASIGAEIGRKFSNKDQWFFEPQTQLTYTYIGSYDFNTDRGVKVESDNVDSLIMRWGLRVGKDFGNSAEEGLYSIYLMGDILHDFLGDQELTVTGLRTGNTAVADFDGERTWYDVGVGFSCTLSENSYMFINYERSLGHDIDNTWEVSAGASMAF